MANALYDPGREGFLAGEIDWDTAVIKLLLVRLTAAGAPAFTASHKFVSDLTATHTIAATSAALSGKTVTSEISAIFTSSRRESRTLSRRWNDSALGSPSAASAQRLIAWIDTGTNLPVVPNGGDINVAWDNGANRIFKL